MQVRRLSETDPVEAVAGVHLVQLGSGDRLNVQHFAIEPGTSVPEHAHADHEQLSFVYEGTVTFLVDGGEVTAGTGDACFLAPGEGHAVENRGDVVARGVDVYSPPRPDPDWVDD